MEANTTVMGSPGPKPKVTDQEIIALLESATRPVWSATELGEYFDVTRQTAYDRLEKLHEELEIDRVKVGNTNAYYIPGTDTGPPEVDASIEERHSRSLIREYTDKFVGLPTQPWTAVHEKDGPAKAGDKIQIRVEGVLDQWRKHTVHKWENRREALHPDECIASETQALISGTLYEKPTVPIEHTDYPADYDLEGEIGIEWKGDPPRQAMIAYGFKNYLIRPCNDAVFLTDVSVDWISPQGEGGEIPTTEITMDMIKEADPEDLHPDEYFTEDGPEPYQSDEPLRHDKEE